MTNISMSVHMFETMSVMASSVESNKPPGSVALIPRL